MAEPIRRQSVLHSPAYERNRGPILAMLQDQLRSLDPAMVVRDALDLQVQAAALALQPLADGAMPATNRRLIFQLEDPRSNGCQRKPC